VFAKQKAYSGAGPPCGLRSRRFPTEGSEYMSSKSSIVPGRLFIICLLFIAGSTVQVRGAVTIAENGTAAAVIVVSTGASEPVQYAAAELASFLGQVTGGTFQIVDQPAADKSNLLVGPGAAQLVDPSFSTVGLGTDGIVIRTVGADLILAGGEPRGTLYAVYTFLEDYVGCHWWSSTESTIPSIPTLTVSSLDTTYVPTFEYRDTNFCDAGDADFSVRNKLNGQSHWVDAKRGGRKYKYIASRKWGVHTFYTLIPPVEYCSIHPEWYSLIDGVRTCAHLASSLDLSNEQMRQQLVQNQIDNLHEYTAAATNSGLSEVRFYLYNSGDFVGNPGPGNGWDTSGSITVTASSLHYSFPAVRCIDGSGLDSTGLLHGNDPYDVFMTSHRDASAPFTPRPGCVDGEHWIQFEFDQPYQLGKMWIWNQNSEAWFIQGFKNVTIQYSITGSSDPADWTTIFSGEIPEARGLPGCPHDMEIDFAGALAKYVVITSHNNWADTSDVTIVSISQPDGLGYCHCDNCNAVVAEEGSYSGQILRFVNSVADDLAVEFPDLMIDTLAYHYSRSAPLLTVPRNNVIIRFVVAYEDPPPPSSNEISYSVPVNDSRNMDCYNDLVAWSQIANHLHVYEYGTCFQDPFVPFPNLRTIGTNLQLYANLGVTGVFEEGWSTKLGTELAELRAWVLAKLMWNPSLDAQSLIEQFCNGYYGPAGPHILAYLNVMHNAVESSGDWLGQGTNYNASYLTFDTLYSSWTHLAAAEAAVQDDPELLRRVRVAQLPVMYVFMMRWYEMREEARYAGVEWPMPVRVQDAYDHILQVGNEKYNFFDPPPMPALDIINLNNYTVSTYSAASEGAGGTAIVEENGATLHLTGNGWRKIGFPYNVTVDTVLEFDFKSGSEGDIHGIGFDDDDTASSDRIFRLYGKQAWGISNHADYSSAAPGWKHYRIRVGQFYTGPMTYLVFANDHDVADPTAESFFSNIRIYNKWDSPLGVTVRASSSHPDLPPVRVIDGSGITADGLRHDGNRNNMWISSVLADSQANPRGGTVSGSHWIEFKFDKIHRVDRMLIWNYNEYDWRIQGAKEVAIQYSTTGTADPADWVTIYEGQIPMADSGPPSYETPVSLVVDFGGAAARYVVITADAGIDMNWSNGGSDRVGLSEVRFEQIPAPGDCSEAIASGFYIASDLNRDCYVNWADFAVFTSDWLRCVDPQDANCERPWQ